MPNGYFIVEELDGQAPIVWSCITDDENAITIFNDVIIAELTGNPAYTFCNDVPKPGYYTTEPGANYYLAEPVKSFRLPGATLSLVPFTKINT